MAEHEKMMADMKAADQRLDDLVTTMNTASGAEKTAATATVVTEMATQDRTRRDGTMKMQHEQDEPHDGAHAGGQGVDGQLPDDEAHEQHELTWR